MFSNGARKTVGLIYNLSCHLPSIHQRTMFIQTLELYKSFTYLLTYLLNDRRRKGVRTRSTRNSWNGILKSLTPRADPIRIAKPVTP